MELLIAVAPGELLDKLTILDIKQERITDMEKRRNVDHEHRLLTEARKKNIPDTPQVQKLYQDLRRINETLWQIEDDIRDCEKAQDFGPKFIELARAVYHTNDKRAVVKRQINTMLGSQIIEEKSYKDYTSKA